MTAVFAHLVFDWDGTLVDTLHAKAHNAARVLAAALGAPSETLVAAYLRHSGVPRRELFDRIAVEAAGRALTEAEFARRSAEFTAANLATLGGARLQPGVEPTLRALAQNGVHLAVSSSAPPDDLEPRVQRSGLRYLFDVVLGSRPGLAKGPEHVAAIRASWGVTATRILMIGDEAADAELARAAGVHSALVLHTLSEAEARAAAPDYVLARFEELLALCLR